MPAEKDHNNNIEVTIRIFRSAMPDETVEKMLSAFGVQVAEPVRGSRGTRGGDGNKKSLGAGKSEDEGFYYIAGWAIKDWASEQGVDPEELRKFKDSQAEVKSGKRKGEKYWWYKIPKAELAKTKTGDAPVEYSDEGDEVPF